MVEVNSRYLIELELPSGTLFNLRGELEVRTGTLMIVELSKFTILYPNYSRGDLEVSHSSQY